MKTVKLTKGWSAIVDDDDFKKVSQHSWCVSFVNNVPRAESRINCKLVRMHRFIMNAPKGSYVDHRNHDPLDNRKENLRICTNQENCFNTRTPKSNTSGYKGVSKHKNRWRAYISYQYKQMHLGIFDTKELAAKAYNTKAKELFGEYATLNNVPD